jgi:hypothetical protein
LDSLPSLWTSLRNVLNRRKFTQKKNDFRIEGTRSQSHLEGNHARQDIGDTNPTGMENPVKPKEPCLIVFGGPSLSADTGREVEKLSMQSGGFPFLK